MITNWIALLLASALFQVSFQGPARPTRSARTSSTYIFQAETDSSFLASNDNCTEVVSSPDCNTTASHWKKTSTFLGKKRNPYYYYYVFENVKCEGRLLSTNNDSTFLTLQHENNTVNSSALRVYEYKNKSSNYLCAIKYGNGTIKDRKAYLISAITTNKRGIRLHQLPEVVKNCSDIDGTLHRGMNVSDVKPQHRSYFLSHFYYNTSLHAVD